jgi:hypothetical protein
MKAVKIFSAFSVNLILVLALPTSALAQTSEIIEPKQTYNSSIAPTGFPVSKTVINQLKEGGVTFHFNDAECRLKSKSGCIVIASNNSALPVGTIIQAIATQVSRPIFSQATLSASCSWCSTAGDFLAITLYVAFASSSAPVAIVVATYSVGIGIILGHA